MISTFLERHGMAGEAGIAEVVDVTILSYTLLNQSSDESDL
jgi:hypothetical protein